MAAARLVVCFWLLTTLGACHGDVAATFSIKTNTPSHVVDDHFISVTIDPASMLEGNRSKGIEKSLRLLKSLSPAYLQIAGPESNKYRYLNGDENNDTSHIIITKSQWIAFNNMARIYGVEPIFCLNAYRRQEDHWDPSNAIELIHFSDKMGYKLNWQLGCDAENLPSLSGEQLGQDLSSLRRILDTYSRYENSLILGPDVKMFDAKTDVNDLTKLFGYEKNVLSAITLRLNSSEEIFQHLDFETVLVNEKKILIDNLEDAIVNTPLWLADFDDDTNDSTSDFGEALSWAQKLGSAAKLGVQLVFKRPKLVHFQRPTPDYWVSFMYRTMVGRTVLEHRLHGNGTPVYMYSHCTNMRKGRSQDQIIYEKGAITLYGVNTEQTSVKINVKTGSWNKHRDNELHQYIITAADIQQPLKSQTVVMNGRPLSMDLSGDLPILTPEVLKFDSSLTLTLPANSIVFWVIPNANVTACLGPIQEQNVPISLPVGLSSNIQSEEVRDKEDINVDAANIDKIELANEENLWNERSRQSETEMNKRDDEPMQINVRGPTNGHLKGIEKLHEESNLKKIYHDTMQQDHLIREINSTRDPVAKVITDKDWDAIKDKYLISKFMFVLKRDPSQADGHLESPIANQDVITVSNDETFGQRFGRALESGVYTIPGLDMTLYQPAPFKNPLQLLKNPLETLKEPFESLKRLREERWEKLQMKKLEIPDDADPVQATMFFPGQLVLEDPKKGKENQEKNEEYVYVDDSGDEGDDGLYDEHKEQNGPGEMYEGLTMEKKKVRNKDIDYGELWEADKGLIEEPSFKVTRKEQEESTRNLEPEREKLRHGKEDGEEKVKEKYVSSLESYETRHGEKKNKSIYEEEKDSENAKERRRKMRIENDSPSEESKLLEFIEEKYKAMEKDKERSRKSHRYSGDYVDMLNVSEKIRHRRHIRVDSQSNNTNTKEREDSGQKLDEKDSVAKLLDEVIELTDVESKHYEEEVHLANSRNRVARHPQTTTEPPEATTKNTKTKLQDAVLFIKEVIKERKESSKKVIDSLKGRKGEDVTLTEIEVVANEKKADAKATEDEQTEKNAHVTRTEPSQEKIDTTFKTEGNEVTKTSNEDSNDTNKRISLMNNKSDVKPLPQPNTHEFLGLENETFETKDKALKIKDDNIDLSPMNIKSNLTNVVSDASPNNDRNVRQSMLNLGPNFQARNPVEASRIIVPNITTVLSDLRARINIPNGMTIPIQESIGLDNMKNLQTLAADSRSGIERTLEASRLRAREEAEKAVHEFESSIASLKDSRLKPKSNFKSSDLNPRLDDVNRLAEVSRNEIERRIEESRLRARAEAKKAVNGLGSSIANLKESRFLPRSSFKGNELDSIIENSNTLSETSRNEIEKRIEESRLRAKAEAEKAVNELKSSIANLKESRFQPRTFKSNDLNATTNNDNILSEVKELENLGKEIKKEVNGTIADLTKQTALMKELEFLRAEILKVTQAARNNSRLEVLKRRPVAKERRNYVSKFRIPNERIGLPIVQGDKVNPTTIVPLRDSVLRSSIREEEAIPEIKVEQPPCEKSDSEKRDSKNENNRTPVNDPFERYILFNRRRDDKAKARSDKILENQKSRARSFASSVDDIAQSMNKEVKDVAGQIIGLPNLVSERIKDNNAIQNVVTKAGNIYSDIGKESSKLVQEMKELPGFLSEKVQENAQVQSAVSKTKEMMAKIDEGLKKLQSTPRNSAFARMQTDADKLLPVLPNTTEMKGRFYGLIQKLEEINKDVKRSMDLPVDRRKKREISGINKRKSRLVDSHRNDITDTLQGIKQKMDEIKMKLRRSLNLPTDVRKKREITSNNQPKSRQSRNHILDEEIYTANSLMNHKRYLRKSLDKTYGVNIHAIRRRDTFRKNNEGQYMSVYIPKGHSNRSKYENVNVGKNEPVLILEQNVNVSNGVNHWEVKMERKQMMENMNKQKLKSTSDGLNSVGLHDYPSYEGDYDYENKNYQGSSQYGIEYSNTNVKNGNSYFDWDNFMMTDHRFDKRNALGEKRMKKRTKRYIIGKKRYALNNKLNMIDFNEMDEKSQEDAGIEKTESNEVMEKLAFKIKPSLNGKKLARLPSVVGKLDVEDSRSNKVTNSSDKVIESVTLGGEIMKEDILDFNDPLLTLKEISKKLQMADLYHQDILKWSKVKENQIVPTPVVESMNLKPDNESESQVEKTEILTVKENNETNKEQEKRVSFFKRFVNRLSSLFRI